MRASRQHARALALAAAFLLLQLAGFLHLASEGHEVCPDHGDLVHVERAQEPSRDAVPPGPDAGAALERADTPGDHVHCGLLPALQPKSAFAAASASVSQEPSISLACSRTPPPARHASVPLLLQAPKLSPPV